ncbi:hypothetical protein RHMOL_Rhmol05G0097000 [Rhododendron molle]|uniref:Uncharacterized protein n=1 Tax=Rhododendron molle TaxID=49168 RepID=A0ACC0NP87_RHOML|nr:hypothetical protein RHMOL_Rhmol05G0097000 [Rhododendron molle]
MPAGVCFLEWRPCLRREITLCFFFAVSPALWLLDHCTGEDRFHSAALITTIRVCFLKGIVVWIHTPRVPTLPLSKWRCEDVPDFRLQFVLPMFVLYLFVVLVGICRCRMAFLNMNDTRADQKKNIDVMGD